MLKKRSNETFEEVFLRILYKIQLILFSIILLGEQIEFVWHTQCSAVLATNYSYDNLFNLSIYHRITFLCCNIICIWLLLLSLSHSDYENTESSSNIVSTYRRWRIIWKVMFRSERDKTRLKNNNIVCALFRYFMLIASSQGNRSLLSISIYLSILFCICFLNTLVCEKLIFECFNSLIAQSIYESSFFS